MLATRFGQEFKVFWAVGLLAAGQVRVCRAGLAAAPSAVDGAGVGWPVVLRAAHSCRPLAPTHPLNPPPSRPQVSTIALTYAGQLVMQGLLRLEIRGWTRMVCTRLVALAPALAVALVSSKDNKFDALNQARTGFAVLRCAALGCCPVAPRKQPQQRTRSRSPSRSWHRPLAHACSPHPPAPPQMLNIVQSIQLPFALIPAIHMAGSVAVMGRRGTFATRRPLHLFCCLVAAVVVGINGRFLVLFREEHLPAGAGACRAQRQGHAALRAQRALTAARILLPTPSLLAPQPCRRERGLGLPHDCLLPGTPVLRPGPRVAGAVGRPARSPRAQRRRRGRVCRRHRRDPGG